jgi:OmpA-OmpF porin, OOP family
MTTRDHSLLAMLLVAFAAVPALAQDEDERPGAKQPPVLPDTPFYLSAMGSYTLADSDRGTDDGYGGMFGIGRRISDEVALELNGLYSSYGNAGGDSRAQLLGAGIDALVFPLVHFPNIYGVAGVKYGHASHMPGTVPGYDGGIVDTGIGFLFPLTSRILLRGDARFRMDWHGGDKAAGTSPEQDRAFTETVFNAGLLIPFGGEKAAEAPAEPVQVVSTSALDSDNDGVPDAYDECPETPAGAVVNEHGCALENDCKKPTAGEAVDENGCAVENKFVLRGVRFEFDSDRLTPDAEQALLSSIETLKAYTDIVVEIQGHTDWIGSERYNQELSARRAKAVRAWP